MGRKVFVVWDAQLQQMQDVLDFAAGSHGDVEIGGLCLSDDQKEGSISANVRTCIQDADRVVAVVDRANANVGFEVGYALGLGKSVALCVSESAPEGHPWLSRPPLADHNVRSVREKRDLVAVASHTNGWRVEPEAEQGAGQLLLCPAEQTGNDIRELLSGQVPGLTAANVPPTLTDVDTLLEGIGAVVWVVPKFPLPEGQRDHPGVAIDAIVAGFALARGRSLHVLLPHGARLLADVGRHVARWARVGELPDLVRKLVTPKPDRPRTWLEIYRATLEKQHERLIPVFATATAAVVGHCYVEVCVAEAAAFGRGGRDAVEGLPVGPDPGGRMAEALPLGELLARHRGGRFLIAGDPGSGKSTMLRHLCWVWATSKDPAAAALPVFVSLSRLAEVGGDPFELAAREVSRREGMEVPGLVAGLRERAGAPGAAEASETRDAGGVWLFLDGLDEVRAGQAALIEQIRGWAKAYPAATIVVTTRPRTDLALGQTFHAASMRALSAEAQRTLLAQWLVETDVSIEAAQREILNRPKLQALTGNPLMLTLIAMLVREKEGLPPTRVRLYERAVNILMTRKLQQEDFPAVKDTPLAKRLLSEMALALHQRGGESWPLETELEEAVWAFEKQEPELYRRICVVWGSHGAALEDIHQVSGLLGPLDGEIDRWRFLHRSFREYFAAVALARRKEPAAALVEPPLPDVGKARKGKDRPFELTVAGWWGETCTFLAGLVPEPVRLLETLRVKDGALFGRVMANAERLPPVETLELIWGLESWEGDWMAAVVAPCAAEDHPDRDATHAWLWGKIAPGLSTDLAGRLHFALCVAGAQPDREAFFRAWGKALPTGAAALKAARFVAIPAGQFRMGSPAGEAGRQEREGPQHSVALGPFSMMSTAVTAADYRRFDRSWKHPWRGQTVPATAVSFWSARLYAVWQEAALPTEAQWEYACRAGSDSRFCSGDTEVDLARVGWYGANAGGKPKPVGRLAANAFGLFDMHGSVFDWCLDAPRSYSADAVADPQGLEFGAWRAVRGGSIWYVADACRSAFRDADEPDVAWDDLGFRLVRPAPAAPSTSDH